MLGGVHYSDNFLYVGTVARFMMMVMVMIVTMTIMIKLWRRCLLMIILQDLPNGAFGESLKNILSPNFVWPGI